MPGREEERWFAESAKRFAALQYLLRIPRRGNGTLKLRDADVLVLVAPARGRYPEISRRWHGLQPSCRLFRLLAPQRHRGLEVALLARLCSTAVEGRPHFHAVAAIRLAASFVGSCTSVAYIA